MSWEVRQGDALKRLRKMPDESVQTVVTSPPYWGLRDYGTAEWEGGDSECSHEPAAAPRASRPPSGLTGGKATVDAGTIRKGDCSCGARRIDSQLGLESTPDCGNRSYFRLRADLTEAQRESVARRLAGVESPDA